MGIDQDDRDDVFVKGDNATDDGQLIGAAGDRLKVDAQFGSNPGNPGCPIGSQKQRIIYSDSDITMPASYSTIYSYSGSGVIQGFLIDFNSDNVDVRLTLDSTEEIFELNVDDIDDIQPSGGEDGGPPMMCHILRRHSGSRFEVCFPCPLPFDSDLLIEGRRSSGGNKTMDQYVIFLTQET